MTTDDPAADAGRELSRAARAAVQGAGIAARARAEARFNDVALQAAVAPSPEQRPTAATRSRPHHDENVRS